VTAWRRSGQTAAAFAAAAGINARTLLWWSTTPRRARDEPVAGGTPRRTGAGLRPLAAGALVELRGGVSDDRFELELAGGRRLRIPARFDAAALERLLRVLL
jgi:hypothetical protein